MPEVVQEAPAEPAVVVPPRPAGPNERVFRYHPGVEYRINVQLGWPVNIMMEPGEVIHNIVGGDRAPLQEGEAPRWEVKEGKSESASTPIAHIFVAASHTGQRQGIVVTTDRRTYHLTVVCLAVTPVRAVRWTYPDTPIVAQPKKPTIFPDATAGQQYHIGYRINTQGQVPDWSPARVLDDGKKMYLLFPRPMLYQAAPLVRGIGPQGPQLVNSRQRGNVIIVDHLAGRLELRVGAGEHAEVVTITRDHLQRITCPGHDECPSWPQWR